MKEMEVWWSGIIPGFKPRGVLHVGAETGGERFTYDHAGLAVVWIEGRLESFQELRKNISSLPNQSAHHLTVTGIDHEPVIFRVLDKEDSSTILPLTALHDKHYGFKIVEKRNEIGRRIDSYFIEHFEPLLQQADLLVIDVQGAEMSVLNSLGNRIDDFQAAKIEVSVFTPYVGGATLKQIDSIMLSKGFARRGLTLGGLSGDAIYARVGKVTKTFKTYMWISRNWATVCRTKIPRSCARFLRRNIYLKLLSFYRNYKFSSVGI